MSYKIIDLKGDNLKKLYNSCNFQFDENPNAIRICIVTGTNIQTNENTIYITTAAVILLKNSFKRAKEIDDDKTNKLLTISNISNNFNDLIYEYTKE